MTTATGPIRLERSQIETAGQVLGRAFFDDPMFMYIEPDDARRRERLPWLMTAGTRYGDLFGEVYTPPQQVDAAAVWLPPGETEMAPERMDQAGFTEAPERLGEEQMGRLMNVLGYMGELHERDMAAPHWYLMILGVDPPRQGNGLGGSVIQPVLARADAGGHACYLETMKPRNVPFYERHGFRVVVEDDVPGGGPHFWTMRREPR